MNSVAGLVTALSMGLSEISDFSLFSSDFVNAAIACCAASLASSLWRAARSSAALAASKDLVLTLDWFACIVRLHFPEGINNLLP
jgi:hypothetical protein